MLIRAFQNGDLEEYLDMAEDFYHSDATITKPSRSQFKRTYDETLENSSFVKGCLIKQDNGETAGYLILSYSWYNEFGGMIVTLEELYVKEDQRGSGIGSQALEWVRKNHENHYAAVRLEVCKKNPRAKALYERSGYEMIDYVQMFCRFHH